MGGDISNENIFTGFHFDIYTGWNKIKLGIKTQLGVSFMQYKTDNIKTQYFMITTTPAIQYQF